jgi:hypothetical protein
MSDESWNIDLGQPYKYLVVVILIMLAVFLGVATLYLVVRL